MVRTPYRRRVAKLFPALLVGVLAGGLLLIDGLVLATVIFVGPLSPYLANGIGMLLFGYAAFCLLTGPSKYPPAKPGALAVSRSKRPGRSRCAAT